VSRLHWKVAGSLATNSNVAEVELVVPAGPEVIVVSGGVASGPAASSTSRSSKIAPGKQ
jgi:hypothetical protein